MRLSFYRFPDDAPEEVRLKEGCDIYLKGGSSTHADHIPEEHRDEVDSVGYVVGPWNVSTIKKYMKKYGGWGFTEHYERDGTCFEVTEIKLEGNNTQFKYNCHL